MRVSLYVSVLLLSISSISWADESTSNAGLEILATAKMSGGCGILGQMVSFQESTKMAGGTEFLNRFMTTEAARLGFTLDKYVAMCRHVHEKYQAMYDAAESESAQ
ncbi:hypothetical protein [Pseudomonas hormoni]